MCFSSKTDRPRPPTVHLGQDSSLLESLAADTSLFCQTFHIEKDESGCASSNSLPGQCQNKEVVSKDEAHWDGVVRVIGRDQYKRGTENMTNVFPCLGAGVLASVGLYCLNARLHDCQSKSCQSRKVQLMKSMPSCQWDPFKDWLITALACHAESGATTKPEIVTNCMRMFRDATHFFNRPLARNFCLDLQGTFDLLTWARRIWRDADPPHSPPEQLRRVFSSTAWELSHEARDFGVCSKRLWDVATISLNGIIGVSPIVQMMHRHDFRIQQSKHERCTEQICIYGDDNSTTILQLHRCDNPGSCHDVEFPSSKLNAALRTSEQWLPSAWSTEQTVEERTVLSPGNSYIAISHVWHDGTGVGLKKPGFVNECLAQYFANIARRLDCHGIWWDAVCIPTEKEARRKAMDNMLHNYSSAEYTVVHDQGLVQFEWRDDGTPCIALLLSAWFTRGWTAAELFASKRVKVLFKDPDCAGDQEPLIKDLDEDILAWEPSLKEESVAKDYPALGYYIASDIIKRYRSGRTTESKDISNFRDLMTLLQPRTTSWARDRMIIAGLMTLSPGQFDSSSSLVDITKAILCKFKRLSIADLYHGEIPISNSGAWSWCPPSLFDLGRAQTAITRGGDMVSVGLDGSLEGCFHAQTLTAEDARIVLPYSSHPAVSARIYEALSRWENCVLLRDMEYSYPLFVLAVTLGRSWGPNGSRQVVDCRYVGSVYFPTTKMRPDMEHMRGIDYRPPTKTTSAAKYMIDCRCRFGIHTADHGFLPEMNAGDLLEDLYKDNNHFSQGFAEYWETLDWETPG